MAHRPRHEDAIAPWSERNSTKPAPALPAVPGASYGATADTSPLKALVDAGGEELEEDRCGVRIAGWRIETQKRPILNAREIEIWEETLGTRHLPEMVFGGSWLELVHEETGVCLNFNALDALHGWCAEALPPVPIPAAKHWSKKSNPEAKIFLEYDYTFTTPYCGSLRRYPPGPTRPADPIGQNPRSKTDRNGTESLPPESPSSGAVDIKQSLEAGGTKAGSREGNTASSSEGGARPAVSKEGSSGGERSRPSEGASSALSVRWEPFEGSIDLELLMARDPILFYDEVVLYEDELADNGVTLLTAKVRVMPCCWFVLLRFWMRVDGARFRLRDARIYCPFQPKEGEKSICPVSVIREYTQREESFEALAQRGLGSETHNFADPNALTDKLKVVSTTTERLTF
ncbi:hypothetical protein KFL_001010260 [Klebsormidium nitens]|uniref:TIP41-like protein n=1 Tax=Klebsormidium nitens TaxID=105231 RepID=A0A1Y1HYX7_KLENI|nr:hypothetical protein KFL_001010260 [Klebsormidium nitens]|eukprot:GAQ82141.1 hypothetical protein KFL_001010260 [Klebsormidium nitens]